MAWAVGWMDRLGMIGWNRGQYTTSAHFNSFHMQFHVPCIYSILMACDQILFPNQFNYRVSLPTPTHAHLKLQFITFANYNLQPRWITLWFKFLFSASILFKVKFNSFIMPSWVESHDAVQGRRGTRHLPISGGGGDNNKMGRMVKRDSSSNKRLYNTYILSNTQFITKVGSPRATWCASDIGGTTYYMYTNIPAHSQIYMYVRISMSDEKLWFHYCHLQEVRKNSIYFLFSILLLSPSCHPIPSQHC